MLEKARVLVTRLFQSRIAMFVLAVASRAAGVARSGQGVIGGADDQQARKPIRDGLRSTM